MEPRNSVHTERIVKVPFAVALIRRMDEAIVEGRGGFRTRAELMSEAVENLLNELAYPEAPPERLLSRAPRMHTPDVAQSVVARTDRATSESAADVDGLFAEIPEWERRELALGDLAGTALTAPPAPWFSLDSGAASAKDEPMLGLHNRDFVSVWALQRLARYTADGPIDFEDFLRRVTRAAWFYGAQLQDLERRELGRKLTVLFPTNLSKRPSAERGFQNFAVGTIARSEGDRVPASGPLFVWKAIDVSPTQGHPVGITETGWRLLKDLDGISLDLPHDRELMRHFMAFIADVAPGDRWGFDHLVRVGTERPDREELVQSYKEVFPHWTPSTASSVAQGYVARAREWGLVEPRLVEGRYSLTETGRQFAQEIN